MAPTPVSAAAPIEQYICTPDEPAVLKDHQFSTYLLNTLKRNAALGPEDPAQINGDTGKRLTYQQYLEQTVHTAQGIRALGLVPGDAVSIIARNTTYTFTTVFGVYLDGVLLHPMYPYLEPELVVNQIHLVRPRIIFAESFALDRVRAAIKTMSPKPRIVVLDSETVEGGMMTMEELIRLGSTVDVESFEEAYSENQEEEHALIIFTTGSTGRPKPVVHTPRSLHFLAYMGQNMFKDSALVGPFVSWITGQGTLLICNNHRVTLVYSTELTLEKQEQFIKEYKVRVVVSSPFSALQMALRGPFPEHLQHILVGGSPMRHSTEKIIRSSMAPGASLMPLYGSTELALISGMDYQGDVDRHYTNGRLRPGIEMQTRDVRTGRPLGPNQRGEVFVRSPTSMKSYYKLPEVTRETIDEHGWVKTGDYGYYDEDKFVYILDRLKDIVFYKDNLILPSELSDVIRLHSAVLDAAVCALPHPEDKHRPVAFVSLKPGKTLTEEELEKHILEYCDDSCKLRGGVVFLERVPRTISGKVASTALLEKIQQMVEAAAS